MKSMRVTCPETAHLETIQYEEHPLGMLIVSCSRFSPAAEVTCERLCTARLDRRRRELQQIIRREDACVDDDTRAFEPEISRTSCGG